MNDLQEIGRSRRNVIEFEKLMQHGEKVELKVDHYFADGVYSRRLYIPKGVILTGKIHKFTHIMIILKGTIEILIDNKMQTITAPYVYTSPVGVKRIMRALNDCELLTVHENYVERKDPHEIESYYTCETEEEYLEFVNATPLLPLENDHEADRKDYQLFLNEVGLTEKFVRQISENEADLCSRTDCGIEYFKIENSSIEGKGVIALIDISNCYYLGKTRIGIKRTPLGRYLNHSKNPNAKMAKISLFDTAIELFDTAIELFAIKNIKAGEEITVDYRQVAQVVKTSTRI